MAINTINNVNVESSKVSLDNLVDVGAAFPALAKAETPSEQWSLIEPNEINAVLIPVHSTPEVMDAYLGTEGEFTSDGERIRLMDGATAGGIKMATVQEAGAFPLTLIVNSDDKLSGYFITQVEDGFMFNNATIKRVFFNSVVTQIGSSAFYGGSGLLGVLDIPSSVAVIKGSAFYGCSSLTGLNLREGLTEIQSSAFFNCSSMTGHLVLPKGFTTLTGESHFRNTKFSSVTFPSSFTTMNGYGATFLGCAFLTTVNFYCSKSALTQDLFDSTNTLLTTVHARENDGTWTAGVQTVLGKSNVNVIKDL
jgi:hypothetical protein